MEIANLTLKLHVEGLAEDTLVVRSLRGEERLAGPFRFELELVSREAALDLDGLLYGPAKLGILQRLSAEESSFQWFQGVLLELEQLRQQQKGQWTTYRAVLGPDLSRLAESWRSRVFQELTTEELVSQVLKHGLGLQPGVDFEWNLTRTKPGDRKSRPVYPEREYVVQYMESDLDFVQRWLEHEGIWYQFDNDGTREKLLFADSSAGYRTVHPLAHRSYPYRPEGGSRSTGGGDGKEDAEEVHALHCRARRRPKRIVLDDYNWRDPQVGLAAEREIHPRGTGVLLEWNHHYKTPAQGATHAETRAQEWSARAAVWRGESTCRGFRPGRKFGLEEHYRSDWNRDYLLVSVVHQAEQSINLEASNVTAADYRNSFECIPADLEFRPERTVPWPYVHGVMHGRIDGEGDGQTADLDEHGRYKVRIPWDENAKTAPPGKGSRWIRMSQPYAGPSSGLHFPLLKGTEVLLVHVDGDPDRPIIAGAIPDAESASPTTQANPTQNKIQTPSGNLFVVDDHPDRSGFLLMDANRCFVQDFRCASSGAGVGGVGGVGGGAGGEPVSEVELRRKIEEMQRLRGDPARQAELLTEIGRAVSRSGGQVTDLLIALGQPLPGTPEGVAGGHGTEAPPPPPDAPPPGPPRQTVERDAPELGDSLVDNAKALVGQYAEMLSTVGGFIASAPKKFKEAADKGLPRLVAQGAAVGPGYQLDARRFDVLFKLLCGGKEILVSNVDTFHYISNNKDVLIADDGGESYSKSIGPSISTEIREGEHTDTSEMRGDAISKSTHVGNLRSEETATGSAEISESRWGNKKTSELLLGKLDATNIHVGDADALDIRVGIDNKLTLNLSGEYSINLDASARMHLDVIATLDQQFSFSGANKFEFDAHTQLCEVSVPDEVEIKLNSLKVGLKETKAALAEQESKVTTIQTAVSDMDTAVTATMSCVKDTHAALDSTKAAINQNTTALKNGLTSLSNSNKYMHSDHKAVITQITSGLTQIT